MIVSWRTYVLFCGSSSTRVRAPSDAVLRGVGGSSSSSSSVVSPADRSASWCFFLGTSSSVVMRSAQRTESLAGRGEDPAIENDSGVSPLDPGRWSSGAAAGAADSVPPCVVALGVESCVCSFGMSASAWKWRTAQDAITTGSCEISCASAVRRTTSSDDSNTRGQSEMNRVSRPKRNRWSRVHRTRPPMPQSGRAPPACCNTETIWAMPSTVESMWRMYRTATHRRSAPVDHSLAVTTCLTSSGLVSSRVATSLG
mmetsp:Transcript_59921/g.160443  ORF Transcript_59921/g.160443 Transcript_59921/m.160443 type:complete len:256 (+) Transcript_59921:685-1452(+)